MSRLPTPGGDDGNWGNVLNDFLNVAHNSDGTLKSTDPTNVYRDQYGNVINGAANIAAFPTDRSGELSDIHVDSTATFTPPPAGVVVHGLKVYGNSTVDMSAMSSPSSIVRSVVVLDMLVTLGDSGVAMTLSSCVFQQSNLNGFGNVDILTGGAYRGILMNGGSFEVSAGLSGSFRVDGHQMWGGTFEIVGDAPVDIRNLTQQGDADLYFSSDTSSTQVLDTIVVADGDVVNTSSGTGHLRISYPGGLIMRAYHNTTGNGDTEIGSEYGSEWEGGMIGVRHSGPGNGSVSFHGSGSVTITNTKSDVTIDNAMNCNIVVNDQSSAGGPGVTLNAVRGMGQLLVDDSTGGITVNGLEMPTVYGYLKLTAAGGEITIQESTVECEFMTMSTADTGVCRLVWTHVWGDDGGHDYVNIAAQDSATTGLYRSSIRGYFDVTQTTSTGTYVGLTMAPYTEFTGTSAGGSAEFVTLSERAHLNISGDSVITNSFIGASAVVNTAGYNMTNVTIQTSGTVTLGGDNTDKYKGFGQNNLV